MPHYVIQFRASSHNSLCFEIVVGGLRFGERGWINSKASLNEASNAMEEVVAWLGNPQPPSRRGSEIKALSKSVTTVSSSVALYLFYLSPDALLKQESIFPRCSISQNAKQGTANAARDSGDYIYISPTKITKNIGL